MFIHDNGKICVVTAARCGHTSMYEYFGIVPYSQYNENVSSWLNSTSRRILVLRHPFDRWMSAQKFDADDISRRLYSNKSRNKITREEWLHSHNSPYLSQIDKSIPFEIIRFDRLSEYISKSTLTVDTDTMDTHHSTVEITPELKAEYSQYRYFTRNCKEISPEEWKLLTNSGDSDIVVE